MDAADLLQLEAAVLRAEGAGGPRCVVVIAKRCDDYPGAAWRCAVLFGALAFLGSAVLAPGLGPTGLALALAIGIGSGLALARWPWLRRLFVSERQCTDQALRRARAAHLAPGLAGDGLLLLVARFERRVVARGGPGTGLAGATLRSVAEQIASQIGDDHFVEGLDRAIATAAGSAALPRAEIASAADTPRDLRPRVVVEG